MRCTLSFYNHSPRPSCYDWSMRVTSISHKGIGDLNEDYVLVDDESQLFGVFDGVSSLNGYLSSDNKTGGFIAAKTAAQAFSSLKGGLKNIALEANLRIQQAQTKAGFDTRNNAYRFGCTAAVVRLKDNLAELLQVGDSVILFIQKDGNVKAPLGYHNHDQNIMRKWRKLADMGVKNIRRELEADMISLRNSANVSYGVLNGDPRLADLVQTVTEPINDVAKILLLTDGMYLPKEDPDVNENWLNLVRIYREGGLDLVYKSVRKIETSDPELIKYPRYKLHDDASGVAIELPQPTS